ncbi:MAG: hypothetical protein WEK74_05685 [Hydrogenophaga sp.]
MQLRHTVIALCAEPDIGGNAGNGSVETFALAFDIQASAIVVAAAMKPPTTMR